MCGALRRVLSPVFAAEMDGDDGGGDGGEAARQQEGQGSADGAFGHIINVSALEGKFYVGKKGSGHPHTNMSKAALNMLTHTSAAGLYQDKILVNAVDTGWVTDMAPGGVGAVAATHATHVGPPLDAVDGAARVLDPIFSHLAEPSKWLVRGKFWKDYVVSSW
jgi:NAD(P)-dependent dehydrogenase (short-subunit alcohol dehydrogenase family)